MQNVNIFKKTTKKTMNETVGYTFPSNKKKNNPVSFTKSEVLIYHSTKYSINKKSKNLQMSFLIIITWRELKKSLSL